MARDHDVDSLSPRLPPPPFPMSLLELRSPGMPPSPPRSLPLWSALELPMGTSLAEETVRDAWNQTEACWNPVIKTLHWMLILWKKPNDFTACLISESDEKPKSIQQNGSAHNMGCWKKSASLWESGRRKKMKCCITERVTGVRSLS